MRAIEDMMLESKSKRRKGREVLESTVELALRKTCEEYGIECRKEGMDGDPDRLLLDPISGCYAWVEVKRPGGKLSPRQKRRIDVRTARGERVVVLDKEADATWLVASWAATCRRHHERRTP